MTGKELKRENLTKNIEANAVVGGQELLKPNEIPSVYVVGRTLPEAWENSVIATLEFGVGIPTEYDQEIDPESRDVTMMITAINPYDEPRIHLALPTGLDGLYEYNQEVVKGVHNHWVDDDKWSYSYHDRITNWPGIGSWEKIEELEGQNLELPQIDQVDNMLNYLAQTPHSRRAQVITWTPWFDSYQHEPPCLQRIWCRVVRSEDEDGECYLLQMNTHWRSRDALKAAFMNMHALTSWQKEMADEISQISGRRVLPGRYVDLSDSYHIYGSDIRRGELEKFEKALRNRTFEQRVISTDDPIVQGEFEIAKKRLQEEINGKGNN